MKRKLFFSKILVIIILITGIFSIIDVKAAINDSNLIKNVYENVYGVWDGPDRVHLFYAQRYTQNGITAYCIEPGVDIDTFIYSSSTDLSISGLDSDTLRYVRLLAYYGYDYEGHNSMNYYLATQELMWEKISGRSLYWVTELNANGPQIDVTKEKNEISKLVENHTLKPSFNAQEFAYNIGDNISIKDNNNVLSGYYIYNSNGLDATINNNTLNINTIETGTYQIQLVKSSYTSRVQLIYYSGNNQKMVSSGSVDPVVATINIKVEGGKITIEKLDKTNNSNVPSGDGELINAKYGVYNSNNELVSTLITGTKNTTQYLPLGNYFVKEIEPSKGYTLDETIYEVTLDKNNTEIKLDVFEEIIKRDVTLFKVYASNETGFMIGEPNVEFEVYLKSTNELYTTMISNEQGYATAELVYGTYIVKQITSTENYYKVDDFEIVIDENTEEQVYKVLANSEIVAKLKVIKIDSETGKVIKRNGIKFKIKNIDTNEYVCFKMSYPNTQNLCEYSTNDDGEFVTPGILHSGKYVLEELDQKIDKYVWNNESHPFEIGENSELITDDDHGILFEVKFENKPVKGKIEINKLGEKLIKENNSYYYNKILLSDVSFGIYANEDIYDGTGELMFSKNDLVEVIYTDENGYAKIENLYLGKYYWKELSSSNNNLVDSSKHEFVLEYKDQYTEIVTITFDVENYLPKGILEFTKTDFSTSETLPNTLIEIYDETNNIVYSGRTDAEGKIVIDDLPLGKYYILEKEAPEGYKLNPEKMHFEIKENGTVIKCTMEDHKINEIPVPNTLKNDSKIIEVTSTIILIIGIGLGVYAKKKSKKD